MTAITTTCESLPINQLAQKRNTKAEDLPEDKVSTLARGMLAKISQFQTSHRQVNEGSLSTGLNHVFEQDYESRTKYEQARQEANEKAALARSMIKAVSNVTVKGSGMVYSDGSGNVIVNGFGMTYSSDNSGNVSSSGISSKITYDISISKYISQHGVSMANKGGSSMMHNSWMGRTSPNANSVEFPEGASKECKERLLAVVPSVSKIASSLIQSNYAPKEISKKIEQLIGKEHRLAAEFCALADQSSFSTKYRFPEEKDLGRCLDKSPFIRGNVLPDPTTEIGSGRNYLDEKGVVQSLTEALAGQLKQPLGIEMVVDLTLDDLQDALRLDETTRISTRTNVIEALKSCAQETIASEGEQ